jgi:hypothetical protein
LRILRPAALLLALLGLGCLYAMATVRDAPLVVIGGITPPMNYGTVRVAGVVERDAYIGRDGPAVDRVSFRVADGSGTLRVVAYGDVAQALVSRGLCPRKGEPIEATGSLRVADGNKISLHLRRAEDLACAGGTAPGGGIPCSP